MASTPIYAISFFWGYDVGQTVVKTVGRKPTDAWKPLTIFEIMVAGGSSRLIRVDQSGDPDLPLLFVGIDCWNLLSELKQGKRSLVKSDRTYPPRCCLLKQRKKSKTLLFPTAKGL